MRYLIIDGQMAGASGDMFLGALLDLQGQNIGDKEKAENQRKQLINNLTEIIPKAASLDEKAKISTAIQRIHRFAFQGIQLKITIEEPHRHLHLPQALAIISKGGELLQLSTKGKTFCKSVIQILFEAEAEAHGETLEKVHLHEAGSLDTFLDILGTAYLLDQLDLFDGKVFLLPIAVGSGTVTFSHGTLPVPAPAVTEIVKKYQLPITVGLVDSELLTPTGASILAAITEMMDCVFAEKSPPIIVEATGVGLGSKEFEKMPNGLRLMIGRPLTENFEYEGVAIIETNIDDCGGETIGFIAQHLLDLGAKDVYLTPIYMKKGRPGTKISVLCKPGEEEKFSAELLTQTSTIGVRIVQSSKIMLTREIKEFQLQIKGKKWPVRGKIAYDTRGKVVHIKPEFDDLRLIAEKIPLPLREVKKIAEAKMEQIVKK
ncbi:MAG: nickel pincer cofactor biosynthesis protein LarC [Candidatus Heimdallarchaeota archaeon]|nr:nickel pincer cofactor biosynthesis protein LarC [Candidatus Heimdallarchaeota archaeon]